MKEETFLKMYYKDSGFTLADKHDLKFKQFDAYDMLDFAEAYAKQFNWVSVTERHPEYNTKDIPAFSLLIEASNRRFYTGYSKTEYGKTTFYQHNGRKILNVLRWQPLPEPPKQ